MCYDNDIKIAGDKPSVDVKRNSMAGSDAQKPNSEKIKLAKKIGKDVADKFIEDANASSENSNGDYEMLLQRRLLLSFTATVGFEQYISDDTLSGMAQKSFLDTLKKYNAELYSSSSDTGAFSFYYLAYRRGSQTERRMGQTFAMLCSHDGDPIFQELGEALYCWFSSVVRNTVAQYMNA
ncbi:MAG: hypothetical protein MJ076_03385 [Clostridia bacterium]|nr:hypothetical protein [Clostridia bacterium]